jgi:hypothetical protein
LQVPSEPFDEWRLEFAQREWQREWDRKTSLEQRGITVITTSGVLVTLAFGFTTAVTKGHRFANFTHLERDLLGVALAFFIAAAICGLLANMPGRIGAFPLATLLPENAADPSPSTTPLDLTVTSVNSVREVNRTKANWLVWALLLQLVAIVALAVTVIVIVV